jgi:hypothetical protein
MKKKVLAFKKDVSPLLLRAISEEDTKLKLNFNSVVEFIFENLVRDATDEVKYEYSDIQYLFRAWCYLEEVVKFKKDTKPYLIKSLKLRNIPMPINSDEIFLYIYDELLSLNNYTILPEWDERNFLNALDRWVSEKFNHLTNKELNVSFGNKADLIQKFGYSRALKMIESAHEETSIQDDIARGNHEDSIELDQIAYEDSVGNFNEFWSEEIDPDFGPGEN